MVGSDVFPTEKHRPFEKGTNSLNFGAFFPTSTALNLEPPCSGYQMDTKGYGMDVSKKYGENPPKSSIKK